MARISLCGGAGFIGSALALNLKAHGHDVQVLDCFAVNNLLAHLGTEKFDILADRIEGLTKAGIDLQVLDARNYHELSLALGEFNPDAIVHLAAVAHVTRANKDPRSTFDHSQRTLENSLDVARNLPVKHFVYLSSSIVYGDFPGGVADEDTPCNPKGLYGNLKLGNESVVRCYRDLYGLPYTIFRPIALYGPGCVSGRVIQLWIERAMRGEPLVVKGDGSMTFTHVSDVAEGIRRVIEHGPKNDVFNLAGPDAVPLHYVASLIAREFNVGVVHEPADKEMPERGRLDGSKAFRSFGHFARVQIERGVLDYIAWYRGRARLQPDVEQPPAGKGAKTGWRHPVGPAVSGSSLAGFSLDPLHVGSSL